MSKFDVIANTRHIHEVASRKLLIGGQTVFASMQPTTPPPGFIQQTPREAAGGLLSGFKKNVPKVYVYVDPKLFELPKARYALTLDAYLGWGVRHRKGIIIMLGGLETEDETSVEILVFDSGALVELTDRNLPERASTKFRAAADALMDDYRSRFPSARFVQSAPLTDWEMAGVEYIGDKPLRRISYRPLVKTVSAKTGYVVPVAIALAGVAFYGGALSKGWGHYTRSVAEYEAAAADPAIQKQGGIDTSYLDVMQQRRFFMDEPRRQEILSQKTASFVRGIGAVPGVKIIELKLPAPSINPQTQIGVTISPENAQAKNKLNGDRAPDVWMTISVPRSEMPAMDQAKQVMTIIANSTGMSLRLAHQGWKDDTNRRILTIEGFIHG